MNSRKVDERRELILSHLKRFDYLSARQIGTLFDLKRDNLYRVMRQLSPYWSVFKDEGMNVYYLNKKGREFTQSEKVRRKLTTAQHYLMRTDLFIHLGQPDTWRNEVRISYTYDKNNPKSRKIIVVADAHFMTGDNQHHVVEIDNAQKMNKNKIKIEKYRRLTEKGVFKGIPELIWVTTTEYRKSMLLDLCQGLNVRILLKGDLL